MVITVLLGLAVSTPSVGGMAYPELASFLDIDLSRLSGTRRTQLDRITRRLDPKTREFFAPPDPHWVKTYKVGQVASMFLRIYPGWNVPDVSYFVAHLFDQNWHEVNRATVPTGYRMNFANARMLSDPWFAQPLLEVHTRSTGPFTKVNGKWAPAFAPDDGLWQTYAFDESGAHLVRLALHSGELLQNAFTQYVYLGPNPPAKAENWIRAALGSADPVRQLSALIWLGGTHLNSKDRRKEGFSRETVASSVAFERLRSDTKVVALIEHLATSRNPWLSRQASFTLAELKKPLAPVEAPPD